MQTRKEKIATNQAWRRKRKSQGICQNCTTPVIPNQTRCEVHAKIQRESTRNRKTKNRTAGICVGCGKNPPLENKARCKVCTEQRAKENKIAKETTRNQIEEALGRKCIHCGYDEPLGLVLDHKYNDGAAHRKKFGSGSPTLYKDMLLHPDRVQLLCGSCHTAKHRNEDVLPPHLKDSYRAP